MTDCFFNQAYDQAARCRPDPPDVDALVSDQAPLIDKDFGMPTSCLSSNSRLTPTLFTRLMTIALTGMVVLTLCGLPAQAAAQDEGGPAPATPNASGGDNTDNGSSKSPDDQQSGINLFKLLIQGGWFMVPLALLSVVVVAVVFERLLALRRGRVMPAELIDQLGELSGKQGGFDPRQAYRICQQFPSATSSVIRAMLLKVGRPQSEVERAVTESSQREAERLHGNVRWLTLAAAVAPLIGLLGTVWGMIMAFYDTTQLVAGQNKAEALAEGIYTALITTLCGLIIAIPAAVFAHSFENRITNLFHQIDELLFNLLPQVERYEGRVRFNRQGATASTPNPTPTAHEENVPVTSDSSEQIG